MDYTIKNSQQLGQVLKGLRREKKLTQQAAGNRIGEVQSAVSQFEAEPSRASIARLFKYLSALGLDLVIRDRATAPKPKNQRSKVEW